MSEQPKRRGRPPLPPEQQQTERVEIRLTRAQAEKLRRLSGSRTGADWLREKIDKARG